MNEDKTRVYGVILFALVGFSALALGMVQTMRSITKPFVPDPALVASVREKLESQIVDQTKDTDADGISDFDEQQLYHTSAYIKDSDSDGVADKAEIEGGTDPNCPEGKDCGAGSTPSTPITLPPGTEPLAGSETGAIGIGAEASALTNNPAYQKLLAGVTDPAELRSLLIEVGIPANQLDSLDDATVFRLYQETILNNNTTTP